MESTARAAAVMWSLLLASATAHAHGITSEGLAYLALLLVGLPLIGAAVVLWLVARVSAPKRSPGEPLAGWRKTASFTAGVLLLLGVLLVALVFPQTIGKEVMRSYDLWRAESASQAEAEAKRDSAQQAAQAQADAFWQCHAAKGFVGHWLVRRQGADYVMGLYADGSFSIRDVFHNDGGLRLVPEGRWLVDQKIVHGVPESADFVWLIPGKHGGAQRIAQRVLSYSREAFSLQDAKGDTVQYSKESGSPEPLPCKG